MSEAKYHDYETYLWRGDLKDRELIDNMVRSHLRNRWEIQGMAIVGVTYIFILFTRGLILEEER